MLETHLRRPAVPGGELLYRQTNPAPWSGSELYQPAAKRCLERLVVYAKGFVAVVFSVPAKRLSPSVDGMTSVACD